MNKDMTQDEVEQARPRSRLVWIAVAALLVASAAAVIVALVWPGWALPGDGQGSGWALSTPEEQAMDAAELEAMTAYIDEHDMQVDSIVVVRHGRIVFEEYGAGYAPDKKHPLYSMTKSVTSMLVGIAIDAGTIEGLDVPVTELLPETTMANLDARKERMTLEHLLAMSDGIDWREHEFPYEDSRNIVNQMGASADAVQFVLDRPMAREPGEAWAYNSGASILMGAILEEATGRNLVQYAREVLFDPIGIGTVYWEQTSGGHYQTGGGLYMTPRDMARLGYLMLRNGTWDGQQIVPADWVDRSTTAYHPADGCHDYGYQWWILPDGEGYMAAGLYDQRIFVLPEADMVVVITADIRGESFYHVDGLVNTFILPACTDLPQASWRETYEAYGFTFEYPGGFCLADEPIPGRSSLSDASGLLQITSNTEPMELVLVLWAEAEAGEDAGTFLEAYLAGLAETGAEMAPGEPRGGRKMATRWPSWSPS